MTSTLGLFGYVLIFGILLPAMIPFTIVSKNYSNIPARIANFKAPDKSIYDCQFDITLNKKHHIIKKEILVEKDESYTEYVFGKDSQVSKADLGIKGIDSLKIIVKNYVVARGKFFGELGNARIEIYLGVWPKDKEHADYYKEGIPSFTTYFEDRYINTFSKIEDDHMNYWIYPAGRESALKYKCIRK